MRKQACVCSLSLSVNQELYARDKLSAIIENCIGNLESQDENRTSAWGKHGLVSKNDCRTISSITPEIWKHPADRFYKTQSQNKYSWLRIHVSIKTWIYL